MKKHYLSPMMLFFLCMISACSTPPPPPSENSRPAPAYFWDSMPAEELVFIGGAGLRSNREESVNLALQDIARKVSIFNAVEGEFVSHNKTGSSFFDYASSARSSLFFDQDYLGFVENLDYDPVADVMQMDNSIFVRARLRGSAAVQAQLRKSLSEGGNARPGWIDNPPAEISGYRVGIGYAGRRALHRDTVNASFEAAIFSIVRAMSSQVSAEAVNYQGPGSFDYRSANDATISARGRLRGLYTLETWIDPSNMGVWTLAIARPETALEEINQEE